MIGGKTFGRRCRSRIRALRVPVTAVLEDSTAPAVWIVDHDIVRRRTVVLGPKDETGFVV